MAHRSARLFVALAIVLFLSLKTIPFAQQSMNTSGTVDTSAAVPRLVAFGGVLRDGKGQPLSGVVGVTLSIYKDQQSGAPLWTENQNVQSDEQGRYSVLIGATQSTGLPMDLFNSSESRWLGVRAQLPGEPEQPRVLMVSVPYALHAANADTIGGKPPSAFVLADPVDQTETAGASSDSTRLQLRPRDGTVSGGTGTPNALTKWLNGSGLLGDSLVSEVNGKVGVNNPNPIGQFDLAGASSLAAEAGGLHVTDTNVIPNKVIQIGYDDASDVGFIRSYQSGTAARPLVLNPQSGNVGVGTTNPIGQLDISTQAAYNAEFGGFHVTNNATNPSKVAQMGFDNNLDAGFIRAYQSSTGVKPLFLNPQGGFVGIGTTSPAATLDVKGDLKVSGNILGSIGMLNIGSGGVLNINGSPFLHNYGTDNTFVGANAGNMSMTGTDNTAGGFQSLRNNTTGTFNTANGSQTLYHNTTGSGNTANGFAALLNNTTGVGNTATGNIALDSNTTGFANTANGSRALPSNTTGSGNTANGYNALLNNTTADNNTASGYNALTANTTGGSNTAFGVSALFSSTTASGNVAMGFNAMYSNTSGSGNTAVGTTALQFNQTGGDNTAVGQNALNQSIATGNTAVGNGALAANTIGGPNNAFGFNALTANTTGTFNNAFGDVALTSNTVGIRNDAFGRYALAANTTGNENIAIGNFAGTTFNGANANVTGSDNIFIGFNAGPGTPTQLNNAVAIGANAVVSASNTMVLGTPGMSVVVGASTAATTFQVVGDIRVGTSGTNGCIQGFGGTPIAGTCSSDERLKQDIEPFASVLDKVTQLQPVTYEWRAEEHPEYHFGAERTSGLIAQEVERVFPNMVATDERGYMAVNYSQLPLLLLQAVRELKAQNDDLRGMLLEQQSQIRQLEALKTSAK